jgi:RNA polymerase sigma-70 factor (ECF subfamily)
MTAPDPGDVPAAVAKAHRRGWALVLAATARVARDLELAEECVQEAYASALATWPSTGIPASPVAWLTTAARRRAVDAIRRERVFRTKLPLLVEPTEAEEVTVAEPDRSPGRRRRSRRRGSPIACRKRPNCRTASGAS